MEDLTVDTAAIKDSNGTIWTLPRPARHNCIVEVANKEGVGEFTKGFLLSDGSFACRIKAEYYARESGQLDGDLVHPHLGGLSSDDLW